MAARSDRAHVDTHVQILSAVLVITYCTEVDASAAGNAGEYAMHEIAALEEVIVSARKRDESLQDIPVSVSVRSGEELKDRMEFRVQEILRSMPNVTTEVQNPRQTSIAIRGLGRSPANDGLESSVGIFVDGVYLGRPGMVITDLIDLERFEVLRGPQGTLFGKNTTAGAGEPGNPFGLARRHASELRRGALSILATALARQLVGTQSFRRRLLHDVSDSESVRFGSDLRRCRRSAHYGLSLELGF